MQHCQYKSVKINIMKDRKKIIAIATSIALLTGLVMYAAMRVPFDEQRPAVGAMAPELDLSDFSGNMINLAALRGNVVLINFWATWCPPCMAELEWFERVHQDYQGKGLTIMAISVDNLSVEQAMEIDATFSVGTANERVTSAYSGSTSVPVSFLIGKDGRVIKKVKRVWPEDDLRISIDKALAQ